MWCGCFCSPASTSGVRARWRPPRIRSGSTSPERLVGLPRAAGLRPKPCCMRADDMSDRSLHVPIMRGLSGRCPDCGQGRLFDGFLALRPRCEHCGLDYSFADAADGPAVFVILLSGFIVVFAALVV